MENRIFLTQKFDNPSILLYNSHKEHVLSVREKLFKSLSENSLKLGNAARTILKNKIGNGPAISKELPMMFELFPWIIKDLSGLTKSKTHNIAVNWLAIYLYVSFLDKHLDSKTEIVPEEFLSASVLWQKGLINLHKIVHGTKFEKMFDDSFSSAAEYQLQDVVEQGKVEHDSFTKSGSASGKNRIIIACAVALAASKIEKSEFILKFTNKILLTVQFLDDLADFEDDLSENNITVLLNEIMKDPKADPKNWNRDKIIYELIKSGSLLRVLNVIESSLTEAILLLNSEPKKNKKFNFSYNFFNALYLNVVSLRDSLESIQGGFLELPTRKRKIIIKETDMAIRGIYLHT